MSDQSPHQDARDAVGEGDRRSTTGTPKWVKVFGIIAIVLVVLLAIALLTGHGPGRHGPGRHLGGARGDMPSGGRVNAGAGGAADADDAARTVEVRTLDTMAFQPARVGVSAGETVTFAVANHGQVVHEFTLGDVAMQQQHGEMMSHMPAGMAHDTPNSITIRPGETKHLTWRFGTAGTLEYACHQPGHYKAGMRGRITIV